MSIAAAGLGGMGFGMVACLLAGMGQGRPPYPSGPPSLAVMAARTAGSAVPVTDFTSCMLGGDEALRTGGAAGTPGAFRENLRACRTAFPAGGRADTGGVMVRVEGTADIEALEAQIMDAMKGGLQHPHEAAGTALPGSVPMPGYAIPQGMGEGLRAAMDGMERSPSAR